MKLSILLKEDGESISLEISDELSLNDLKSLIEAETEVPYEAQTLVYDGKVLANGGTPLSQSGIRSNGLIVLQDSRKDKGFRESNSVSTQTLPSHAFMESTRDPNNPEFQSKIMEMIRQNQIEENLQLAYDISPESFVAVNLLYIKLRINGHDTYALVDTGAQQTVLHPKFAEEFGISHLIDRRFASKTIGVGTQQSGGRIHSVPVSLGDLNVELPCSFTILDIHVGILFGLDMLRRHKICVDLENDALLIGDKKVRLLSDHEIENKVIPSQARLSKESDIPKQLPPHSSAESRNAPVNEGATGSSNDPKISFPQASIDTIISMGFTEREAREVLKMADGNVELALSLLF